MAKRIIKNNRQVIAARNKVLQKDVLAYEHLPSVFPADGVYKAYTVVRLVVSPDKKGVKGRALLTQVPASRKSPWVEDLIRPETVQGVIVDRYCPAFLNLRVETRKESDNYVVDYLQGAIYAFNSDFFVAVEGKQVMSLLTGDKFANGLIFADGGVKEGVLVYGSTKHGCATSSNGQVKKKEITLPCNNLPGFDYRNVLNTLTFGLLDIIEAAKRDATTLKQVAQLSTRIAQVDAPAVEGIKCNVFAVYMGIYSPLWDGQFYLQDEYVADWYTDRLGGNQFSVLRKAVRGITLQSRPYMCKGNGRVKARRSLDHFLNSRGWEVEVIERENLADDDQPNFNEAVWSKGKKGAFAGKLVIVCDNKEQIKAEGVQVFTDLNGLKETFDLTRKSGLNVLDTTEESEDVQTSTQTFATFMVADEAAAHNLFLERTENAVSKVYDSIMAEEGVAVTSAELDNAMNLIQLGNKVFPQFMRECWRPGYKSMVDNAIEGLSRKVGNCNLTNEGAYDVFVVDACLDYGFEGLKFENGICEVLCKDIKKESMLVRFPKANAFGFSIVRPVTVDTIMERAKAAGISEYEQELLRDELEDLAEGIVMLPASQSLMDKHDGHDFDGDHGQLTEDAETVSIVRNKPSMVVHICSDMASYGEGVAKHCR